MDHFKKCFPSSSLNDSHCSHEILVPEQLSDLRPIKYPCFFFSKLRPGKVEQMYPKQSPERSSALPNCFIGPSLMCSGGKMMFFRSTKGLLTIFFSPGYIVFLGGHSFLTQCSSLALLTQ